MTPKGVWQRSRVLLLKQWDRYPRSTERISSCNSDVLYRLEYVAVKEQVDLIYLCACVVCVCVCVCVLVQKGQLGRVVIDDVVDGRTSSSAWLPAPVDGIGLYWLLHGTHWLYSSPIMCRVGR